MEVTDEDKKAPITILRPKTKALICDMLNPFMLFESPSGVDRYWRGLAGLCQIDAKYEATLSQHQNPTSKVLDLWYQKEPQESTIDRFLAFLEEMDRFDVQDDIRELIDDDIRFHKSNPQGYDLKPIYSEADKDIITRDDVKRINEGQALEIYDAFLLYDHDDIEFAIELLEKMEKDYGMKFCVKDRDLVGGGLELDKMIKLIQVRCNRIIVILSDSFLKSSANDYYLTFAHAYGIESQRKIIPCIYKDITLDVGHMKFLFTLDYRRYKMFNFWEKLRDSISMGDMEKFKVNRSQSDNGQVLTNALNQRYLGLRPLHHAVKFSSSVGDLKTSEAISEPTLNPSTSADNLETCSDNHKKQKKVNLLKKLSKRFKKEKTSDCSKEEKEKSKGLKKQMKRATAVAN